MIRPNVAPASQQNALRLTGQKRREPAKRLALHLAMDDETGPSIKEDNQQVTDPIKFVFPQVLPCVAKKNGAKKLE